MRMPDIRGPTMAALIAMMLLAYRAPAIAAPSDVALSDTNTFHAHVSVQKVTDLGSLFAAIDDPSPQFLAYTDLYTDQDPAPSTSYVIYITVGIAPTAWEHSNQMASPALTKMGPTALMREVVLQRSIAETLGTHRDFPASPATLIRGADNADSPSISTSPAYQQSPQDMLLGAADEDMFLGQRTAIIVTGQRSGLTPMNNTHQTVQHWTNASDNLQEQAVAKEVWATSPLPGSTVATATSPVDHAYDYSCWGNMADSSQVEALLLLPH